MSILDNNNIAPITVVIPAYNASHTIYNTLESVRLQSLLPSEVIVVDDGSTDNTFQIVSDYIYFFNLENWCILSQNNSGPSSARDKAIRLSKQKYIALLDSDDIWLPEKISVGIRNINAHNLDIIGASPHAHLQSPHFYLIKSSHALFQNPYFTSTVIFLRSAYIEIGGFDLYQKYAEDYKLWLKFILMGMRCGHIGPALTSYYMSDQNLHQRLSSNIFQMQRCEIKNFNWLYSKRLISLHWLFLATIFSWLKFFLRIAKRPVISFKLFVRHWHN